VLFFGLFFIARWPPLEIFLPTPLIAGEPDFLEQLNYHHPCLHFTSEKECSRRSLPFLDVMV